jgi:hypothetical protein
MKSRSAMIASAGFQPLTVIHSRTDARAKPGVRRSAVGN